MERYYLDARTYTTPREVHEALARLFGFPDYYGCNADALNDCLSERGPVSLCVLHPGTGKAAQELELCCRVIEDNGGETSVCR